MISPQEDHRLGTAQKYEQIKARLKNLAMYQAIHNDDNKYMDFDVFLGEILKVFDEYYPQKIDSRGRILKDDVEWRLITEQRV